MIKYILTALLIGGATGYLNRILGLTIVNVLISNWLFTASLCGLLFVMGLAFALDRDALARFRRGGAKIFVIPILVAVGSLVGGFVGGLLLRIDAVKSMAVCGGFGWYTLAGPLVGSLFGTEWGACAFAVNFLRELFTIVAISLLARFDKFAPIASGGATSMDTTLPVIVKYGGNEVLIAAFSSGFILSLTAPIIITTIGALA
jgi:uncharacterized membrane protein YbjE (DUF340 family)